MHVLDVSLNIIYLSPCDGSSSQCRYFHTYVTVTVKIYLFRHVEQQSQTPQKRINKKIKHICMLMHTWWSELLERLTLLVAAILIIVSHFLSTYESGKVSNLKVNVCGDTSSQRSLINIERWRLMLKHTFAKISR